MSSNNFLPWLYFTTATENETKITVKDTVLGQKYKCKEASAGKQQGPSLKVIIITVVNWKMETLKGHELVSNHIQEDKWM